MKGSSCVLAFSLFIEFFLGQELEYSSYHKGFSLKKKSIKRTMDAKKHVLNGDPKFVKANGSSSKSKG
jgi:hypothetical protein